MKILFTLLLSLFTVGAVFAQEGHRDYDDQRAPYYAQGPYGHDFDRNFDGHGHRFMHRIVERINFKYDQRIARVQNNPYLGFYERDRITERLEWQRRQEIREAWERFKDRDHDDDWRH